MAMWKAQSGTVVQSRPAYVVVPRKYVQKRKQKKLVAKSVEMRSANTFVAAFVSIREVVQG